MTGLSTPNLPVENKAITIDEVQGLIRKTNPQLLASTGFVVIALLLWLMRFKPF